MRALRLETAVLLNLLAYKNRSTEQISLTGPAEK